MSDLTAQIADRLDHVKNRLERAAQQSKRPLNRVKLVVVSKAQPVDVLLAAYQAGVRLFGENYPQEAEEKIVAMGGIGEIEWHMIGHLQSRKVKIAADHFQTIHSIDRLSIAQKLNQLMETRGRRMPVLLEVNLGGEETKQGWLLTGGEANEEVLQEFVAISRLPWLQIEGLMTMPPYFENPEKSRPYFRLLRQLSQKLKVQIPLANWEELSMGTSGDYEVAVEEGATFVRIGRAILGARPNPV